MAYRVLGAVVDRGPQDAVGVVADKITAPFSQLRVHTVDHGAISLFATGNVIRAAKGHPAAAVAAMAAFARWLAATAGPQAAPPWFAAVSAPNAVATGEFHGGINPEMAASWAATKTSKFPGIAVTLGIGGITPEVFPKPRGTPAKFILPGFKSPTAAAEAAAALAAMQKPSGPAGASIAGEAAAKPRRSLFT